VKKQRTFTPAFKAKIALELVKGVKTMQQISKESEVHLSQLAKWKNTLINNANTVFEKLLAHKVLIRNVGKMHMLLDNCLRLTVGTPEENDQFLSILRTCLS